MTKIATVFGARPQFIKGAVVSKQLRMSSQFQEVVIHTGQHYDANMSDIFFDELGMITPKYNLGINGVSHGKMTGQMIIELEAVLKKENPDALLVYGDTNSTLAGAIAASKMNIKIVHVEAGVRSFNMKMPEEINRILTDKVSDVLFTPTEQATNNLLKEGHIRSNILNVGDVMYDAALEFGKGSEQKSEILERLELRSEKYLLVTLHREENTENQIKLNNIIDALLELSMSYRVIWPIHPRTRRKLQDSLSLDDLKGHLDFIEPVGFTDMIVLERNAAVIMTDSGGVQKEAYFHKTPCVTLREETEWVELIESNWNVLCPPDSCKLIVDAVEQRKNILGTDLKSYGNGNAASAIVSRLSSIFS